jgi:gas vesicle protein
MEIIFSWLREYVPNSVWALILLIVTWHARGFYMHVLATRKKVDTLPCDTHAERLEKSEKVFIERLDAISKESNERMDAISKESNERMDAIAKKSNERMDAIAKEIKGDMAELANRMDTNVKELKEEIKDLKEEIATVAKEGREANKELAKYLAESDRRNSERVAKVEGQMVFIRQRTLQHA